MKTEASAEFAREEIKKFFIDGMRKHHPKATDIKAEVLHDAFGFFKGIRVTAVYEDWVEPVK